MTAVLESIGGKLEGQLFSYIQTQGKYAKEFKGQLESMKTQLDLMMAFLTDTESLKNKDEPLKMTLKKMTDLVYEADDILTDFLVRDEYRHNVYCSSEYYPTELKFRYETGHKLKEINSKINKLEKALSIYLRPQQQGFQGGYMPTLVQFTSREFDPYQKIGLLETDAEKIKGWIFGASGVLHRIGVVGMGGLGKTTLARKVFNDKELVNYFDLMIWVCVSQDYNEERIMRSILEQLEPDYGSITDQGHMLREIHQLLKNKSCLIVMDDVWQIDLDWWGRLCSGLSKAAGKSSCAIITTRSENVAIHMGVDNSSIHRPEVLNKEESWKLFCLFAFSGNKGRWPNAQFKRLGQEILEKCHGLPLAIKTIGGLLAAKLHSCKEWEKVLEDFKQLTTRGKVNSVIASLQLSYDALPPHLKQCLLCFAIYPEDMDVFAEQLVHWWVGEGLVQSIETGYKHLQELVSRCLIEPEQRRGYDGKVYLCKVHDIMRDLMMNISDEETLCTFDNRGKQILTVDSRWLGYRTGMNVDGRLFKSSSGLRVLLVMQSTTIPLEITGGELSSLRVLDFSQAKLDTKNISVEDLFNWICSLKRLACLNLSGLKSLRKLPSSIQKLKNLQFLILTGCSNLTKISASVTFLKRLVVLGLGSCRLDFLPKGLGHLSHLQELFGFKVVCKANTNCFRLSELQKLSKLNVLGMSVSAEMEISENEWDVLCELKELRVLSIDTENSEDRKIKEILDRLSPPPSLRELYLRRYRDERLPKWINSRKLKKLEYLCIEDGGISTIRMADKNEEGYPSWSLEGLCLKFLPNLVEDWKNLEREMPLVHYMEISHCYNLQNFPCSVKQPGEWRKEHK